MIRAEPRLNQNLALPAETMRAATLSRGGNGANAKAASKIGIADGIAIVQPWLSKKPSAARRTASPLIRADFSASLHWHESCNNGFVMSASLRWVALAFGFGVSACSHGTANPAPSPSPPVSVQTVTAREGVIAPTETLPGLIAPHQNVGLSSSLAEPAVAVNVREGDAVHQGEVIAVLATDDLEASLQSALQTAAEYRAKTAQTAYSGRLAIGQGGDQVRVARAALAQAQVTLAQAQQLLGRERQISGSYLPISTVDQQRTLVATDAQAVRSAQASLTSALQNVAVNGGPATGLQAANVAGAQAAAQSAAAQATLLERDIARGTIRSPIDGYVVNRNLNPGEYPSGRQIFTLQETAHVYAILRASSDQVFRIRVGAQATIRRTGGGAGSFPGTVSAVLGEATPGSTNFTVEADVPNDRGVLISGMPVAGRVALPHVRGIEVPQTAFLDDSHDTVMAVVDAKAKQLDVTLQATDGKHAIVGGVPAGTHVIADGTSGIASGQTVATR